MAYTYLITGATSDVGAALIRHLLTEAPGEDRTILAQGCGDLARLDALVQQFPGRIVTFPAPKRWMPCAPALAKICPAPPILYTCRPCRW